MSQTGKNHTFLTAPFPVPYGARVVHGGVHFSIFSRHADKVWVMLFDHPDDEHPVQEIELEPERHRLGDLWHILIPNARAGQFYVYRMDSHHPLPEKRYFRPSHWLLDPYALAISGSPTWGDRWDIPAGETPTSGARFPKGVIVDDHFDWSGDVAPDIPLADSIFYEVHVRGFTANTNSGVRVPGTYQGFIDKIPYLLELGVTTVEFLPIHEFNEMEYHLANDSRRELRNYWGYSTQAFFAPNARYAAAGVHGQQVREFKMLVKELHKAGIEVILDVVFNHTIEGERGGPIYSFRGIDNFIYYLMDDDRKHFLNYSGCGNTLNCNHPVVRQFILDCLRYWVTEMHVDGFRFDLATVLTRGEDGQILPHPPLIESITEDPILRHAKLIAEAWDASGAYQVGSFPSSDWSEWNGRYRDDIRQFWKGDAGMLGGLAHRIAGSADLYDHDGQTPSKSINFVTCHDGFTLYDLVSYRRKRNEANQEHNRDGERHNHSFNCGIEGPTDDPEILTNRVRRMKNIILTLMVSQGVPMLLAGDEFANTQHGNNNAYCQDNELTWIDWSLLEKYDDLVQFTKKAIALRKRHPALRRRKFFTGRKTEDGNTDIAWSGPDGQDPDWEHGSAVGGLINGARKFTGCHYGGDDLFLIFNAGTDPVHFQVQPSGGKPWRMILSTEEKKPNWTDTQHVIHVGAQSVTVLAAGRALKMTEQK